MLARRASFERGLAKVVEALEAGLDLTAVLESACEAVARELRAGRVSAYTLSEDGAALDRLAGEGPAHLEPVASVEPTVSDRAVMLPLVSARRTLGLILAEDAGGRSLERARVIAGVAAQAVESARLWQSVGERAGTLDLLTGLPNHRGFQDRLARELARAKRTGASVSVAMLDIDRFGEMNERHGHQGADALLRTAARCFAGGVRSYDTVCRMGADEFALVLPGLQAEAAGALVTRLGRAFAAQTGVTRAATVSGGVASFPRDGSTQGELLRLATGALYWARRGGGDRIVVYDATVVEALSAEERAAQLEKNIYERTVRAIEATRGHSATARAVSDWAGFLAAELGLPPDRVDRLRLAAFLYDATAPAGDPSERARIAAHVATNALDAEAAEWLLAPRTPGEPAPIESRVVAVADAFVRAGGHASSAGAGRALAELWRRAGSEFDPSCVRALEALLARRAAGLAPTARP
jgi:diguanylate cyclase (GGDEF)-like protein